jgi:hypothetical protein
VAKSAPRARSSAPRRKLPHPHGTAVLDPFAVYAQSEGILRQELGALSVDHLRTIIDAYGLDADDSMARDEASVRAALADHIVGAVKRLATTG